MHPLQAWLDKRQRTAKSFAAEIGLDGAALSRILRGRYAPSLATAVRIEDATRRGVTMRMMLAASNGAAKDAAA